MAIRFRAALAVMMLVPFAAAAGCTSGGPKASPANGAQGGSPGQAAASRPGSPGLPRSPGSAAISLSETGSTLLYPLLRSWAAAYHQRYPNVSISTAPTGSGTGIADAAARTADLGASDAFLSSGDLVQSPGLLNIPLAISAQQVDYNLPRLGARVHLRLSGAVLAGMYTGKITSWNDRAIAALNPGVALPALKVVPLHRAESSGDTFLFSSYLSTGDPGWGSSIGYGTTIAWPPVPGALAEQGNGGMVTGCAATPGCVAYIGISYLSQALSAGLGEAALRSAGGQFTLPTGPTMRAAVATFVPATPANETISMVNGPAPGGYPIVNYEYAIVATAQPSAAKARALKAFLHWAITTGNAASYLGQVRFDPLPAPVVALADAQIASIR